MLKDPNTMTKKQIVDELELYTTLVPNRRTFERDLKYNLIELLIYFRKKNDKHRELSQQEFLGLVYKEV